MKQYEGFSLLELMVVVVILGILAAIAIPSYQSSAIRGQRANTQAVMLEIIQAQDRFYAQNLRYTTNISELDAYSSNSVIAGDGNYTIVAQACDQNPNSDPCAQLNATRNPADPECGTISLDTFGARNVTAGSVAECW